MPLYQVENIDCMIGMSRYPDKYFQLAIVDPPYGIEITKQGLGEGGRGVYRKPKTYKRGEWDSLTPTEEYFNELQRVSINQIIWGGNYFELHPTPCFIFWDKNNGGSDFADGELAWTSFKSPIRKFKYTWRGFIQGKMGEFRETRIHPTQKPIDLYKWLLRNYAKPGDKILDTHGGSMSSVIACIDGGFSITCFELDKVYFDAGNKRIENHIKQLSLF